jgi:hypothetical protein
MKNDLITINFDFDPNVDFDFSGNEQRNFENLYRRQFYGILPENMSISESR